MFREELIIRRFLLTLSLFFLCSEAGAQRHLDYIGSLLELPSDQLDFAKIKLAVDQVVDPTIDSNKTMQNIEAIVSEINSKLPPGSTSMLKLQALRNYLYGKHASNNHQPYQYDFDDPKGKNLKNKTLGRYITSKKGNCVSMPVLMLVIADRMGLDVGLAAAPEHVLIKFAEPETGKTYNVEATSGGGFARAKWYQDQMHITDQALKSGIYLQKLSRKETAAEILSLLGEHYYAVGDYDKAIETFKFILRYHPRSVYSILKIGASYAKLFNQRFAGKYRTDEEVPPSEWPALKLYVTENRRYFEMAESLGWREAGVDLPDGNSRRSSSVAQKPTQHGYNR
jgi:regulator of sirC expression with transglutaminase-like and TPR domain